MSFGELFLSYWAYLEPIVRFFSQIVNVWVVQRHQNCVWCFPTHGPIYCANRGIPQEWFVTDIHYQIVCGKWWQACCAIGWISYGPLKKSSNNYSSCLCAHQWVESKRTFLPSVIIWKSWHQFVFWVPASPKVLFYYQEESRNNCPLHGRLSSASLHRPPLPAMSPHRTLRRLGPQSPTRGPSPSWTPTLRLWQHWRPKTKTLPAAPEACLFLLDPHHLTPHPNNVGGGCRFCIWTRVKVVSVRFAINFNISPYLRSLFHPRVEIWGDGSSVLVFGGFRRRSVHLVKTAVIFFACPLWNLFLLVHGCFLLLLLNLSKTPHDSGAVQFCENTRGHFFF